VQSAECTTNFGNRCLATLKRKPSVGNHILIFASSYYGTEMNAPSEFVVDFSIGNPRGQLIASKYVGRTSDATREILLRANDQAYFKAIVVEVKGLAISGQLDAVSKQVNQRDATGYSIEIPTATAGDVLFAMHHSLKHDLTADEAHGWIILRKVMDPTYGDTLMVQYRVAGSPQSYSASETSTPASAQNVASVAVAYKLK